MSDPSAKMCREAEEIFGRAQELAIAEKTEEAFGPYLEAAVLGIPYFTTTLPVSPHKNFAQISAIGEEVASAFGVRFLPFDFKKKDGFKRSIELSREFGLYRQNYCGCEYSRQDRNDAI